MSSQHEKLICGYCIGFSLSPFWAPSWKKICGCMWIDFFFFFFFYHVVHFSYIVFLFSLLHCFDCCRYITQNTPSPHTTHVLPAFFFLHSTGLPWACILSVPPHDPVAACPPFCQGRVLPAWPCRNTPLSLDLWLDLSVVIDPALSLHPVGLE